MTSNEYVPAVNPVTVDPVCPLTLELQFKVNGGSPPVINVFNSPSLPEIGCVTKKSKYTGDDAVTYVVSVC